MKKLLLCCSLILFTLYGCSDDDLSTSNSPDEGSTIEINIENLPGISETAQYQAWFYGEKSPVGKIAVLTPDANGRVHEVYNVKLSEMKKAKYILVTVEAKLHDTLIKTPSALPLLAGTIGINNAPLNADHFLAKKLNFSEVSGKFMLYTPTDDKADNEKSGVWFQQMLNNQPAAGLVLPEVPAGCVYQGWITVNGKTLSTGQFSKADEADLENAYSGTLAAPVVPGEDFIANAPTDWTFPIDLSGASLFVTLETSAAKTVPAGVKVLQTTIPAGAAASTVYDMQPVNNTVPPPTGSLVMNVNIN